MASDSLEVGVSDTVSEDVDVGDRETENSPSESGDVREDDEDVDEEEVDEEEVDEEEVDDEEYIRGHVHALQLVMDGAVVGQLLEDKEALRAASARLQETYGSGVRTYFDDELLQRTHRVMQLLTVYFERVGEDARGRNQARKNRTDRLDRRDAGADASRPSSASLSDGSDLNELERQKRQFVERMAARHRYGTSEGALERFEHEVVYGFVGGLLPAVLGMMMQRVERMPAGAMAGLLVSWGRLCGEMLGARMMEMMESGRCFALRYEVEEENATDEEDAADENRENAAAENGTTYASHVRFVEQVRVAFETLTEGLKLVDDIMNLADASAANETRHRDHVKLMVFEMERLEPARLTEWVDVEARRMPVGERLWGRFHAAVVVDVFGKMDWVVEALRIGESLAVDVALLKFVKEAMPVLAEEKRRVILDVLGAVCERYTLAFDEGEERDVGLGDDAAGHDTRDHDERFGRLVDLVGVSTRTKGTVGHAILSLLLPALETVFEIVAKERAKGTSVLSIRPLASGVASLEERVIWRLFVSKNVSEQLLALTSLHEILVDVADALEKAIPDGGSDDALGQSTDNDDMELQRLRIAWIRSSEIVSEMLKVNLHHAQYVEDMVQLLGSLSELDLVDAGHVSQLWSMVQDEGTFEEIKSNVCLLLGYLATALSSAHDTESFCQNLQGNCDAQRVEPKYIEEMLLSASRYDRSLRLMVRIVDILLGFCLDGLPVVPRDESTTTIPTVTATTTSVLPPNRTKTMRSGDLLLDVFRRYISRCQKTQNDGPWLECIASVIGTCMQRINVGAGEEGARGVFLAPDASDLLQPLRLLLRIFTSKKLSKEELHAVYKVINDGAKFMGEVVAGYEQNLVRMSHSPHSVELLRVFNAILRSVLSESNYYLDFSKVEKILGWATTTDVSAESSTYAWSLLTSLVQDERGVSSKDVESFVYTFMEEVEHLTAASWLCFTAYLAVLLDYRETRLPAANSYVDLIVMNEENRVLEVWNPLKDFLCGCLLECCDTDEIAAQCSKLLSHVLISDMDLNTQTADPQRVKITIESFKRKLMDKPDRVMMFLSDVLDVYDYRDCDDYQAPVVVPEDVVRGSDRMFGAEGASTAHLSNDEGNTTVCKATQENVSSGRCAVNANEGNLSPVRQGSGRPLYSCYKEWDVSFIVVLKNLPMSPRPAALGSGGHHQTVEIICPRNCMVADLRAIVSQQASHLVGYMIPHANFILQNAGKTLNTNRIRLFECITDGDKVFAVFSTKSSYRAPPVPDFQLSHMLAQDEWFFGSLMALGDSGSRTALELIIRLPICEGLVPRISQSCVDKEPGELGTSFMLYTCRLVHANISPMSVEGVAFCNVDPPQVNVPAPRLVLIMSHLYRKVGVSMGGEVPRMIIHLLSGWAGAWASGSGHDIRNRRSTDRLPDGAENTDSVALKLLHDVLADSLRVKVVDAVDVTSEESVRPSVEDVRFVTSGALTAILSLLKKRGSIPEEAMQLLIDDVKNVLRHGDSQVRIVGFRTVRALISQHDNMETVLLREVISDILLWDDDWEDKADTSDNSAFPAIEPLKLCSWFINRLDASHNRTMLNITKSICERIMRCLQDRSPAINGHSKCLQIALQRVDASDLLELGPLVSEVLDTFLFNDLTIADSKSYSESFQTSKYALDQDEALYRVLVCCSMLSGPCWTAFHDRHRMFFTGVSFPGLYNNSAPDHVRDLDQYCGLLNGGATCYMNATFQQLYMMPRLRRLLLAAPVEEDPDKCSPVFEALRTIFLRLFGGIGGVVDPSCFWREFKDYDGNAVDVREHQDGYEFFTRLQDAVDEYLKSLGHVKIMRSVLGGSFNQIIEVPEHEGIKSEREEEFYQISVDVRGKKNLQESLDSYVAPETLDGQNQWFCESLGHKVDAKKRTLIKKLPESLVFHLKRFEWDYETYQRFKIKDRFEFPTELDMSPYVDIDGDNVGGGGGQMYDLSGVVVHSGTAFAGHYYSFAKERETGKWYHFDDDCVVPWDVADIDQECFGGPFQPNSGSKMYMRSQSAYMVIYDRRGVCGARDDHADDVTTFDAICSTVPSTRLRGLLEANQTEMNKAIAFSSNLSKIMKTISMEVQKAICGPQSSRKLKSEDSMNESDERHPFTIPIHNEVFYISPSHENILPREIPESLNQAVVLALDYVCHIAVCGPFGRDPAENVLQPLMTAFQEPSTACYVMAQEATIDAVLRALTSPYRLSRNMLRSVMATCVKAAPDSPVAVSFLEKVLNCIKHALETPALLLTWRDPLGLLVDISHASSCADVMANYTDVLLSFSDVLYELWQQQTKRERDADGAVLCAYAVMVCNMLRRHRLANDEGTRHVQSGNPFCISRDRELAFDVPSDKIKQLTSMGMEDGGVLLFLQFFSWESSVRSSACIDALLAVANLTDKHRRLVPLMVEYMRLDDNIAASRTRDFVRCSLELFEHLHGNGLASHIISIVLASVLTTSGMHELGPDTDLVGWARASIETCSTLSRRLVVDRQYRIEWERDVPESCDQDLQKLYDPVVLLATIRGLVGDVAEVVPIDDDDDNGMEEHDVDLVRASESDEKENGQDDEVKEIVLD